MNTNFHFLKKINNDLYEIITDAEKLYKDEYFEQCIAQTRRFAEQICSNILEQNNINKKTFDEMLEILKDNSNGTTEEKEFIDDLYFIKKQGNISVHAKKVKKDAITALECLKRAFEIAINYCVYNQNTSKNILKLNYDVELLITGTKIKKNKFQTLEERYKREKTKQSAALLQKNKNNVKTQIINQIELKQIQISLFWKTVIFFLSISMILILFLIIKISLLQNGS